MKCPTCDHEDTRTEVELYKRITHLSKIIDSYKETPTIKDQFAMAALTGIAAHGDCRSGYVNVAKDAYTIADAMMQARHNLI